MGRSDPVLRRMLQMRQFRRFLDSSLRVVRRKVCVRWCRITHAMMLTATVAHCDRPVVLHASRRRRRVREVGETENRCPGAGHRVYVASADVDGAALHVRGVVAVAV